MEGDVPRLVLPGGLQLFIVYLFNNGKYPLNQDEGRRVEAGVANIAILRRYECFFTPPEHEHYHNHGWYQCQSRKDTFRIVQDK